MKFRFNVQVFHILTGRNKPSLDFVSKILTSYPELNSDWLLFGKGQMLKSSQLTPQKKESEIFHTIAVALYRDFLFQHKPRAEWNTYFVPDTQKNQSL